MASILNTFLKQIFQGDTVKDWDHASKLYVANNYALAPKNTFLYHVFFDLNRSAVNPDKQKQIELGMLVKQTSLPKFSIDTKVLNAYNRPNIVQNKIHYDPVNITFHDDSADVVRNFWYDYYGYYYRDNDHGGSSYLEAYTNVHNELTSARLNKDWGYTIRGTTNGTLKKASYLTAIRIYSLYNKKFSEYILVNPFIKSFQNGEHNSSGYADTMQHSMTVEYESVLYAYGNVSVNTVHGFADLHYDKRPSPLSPAGGGTRSVFGPGGIAQTADEIIKDVAKGDFGSAIFKAGRVGTTMSGGGLGAMIGAEAIQMGRDVLRGNNPFGSVQIPGMSTPSSGAIPDPTSVTNNPTSQQEWLEQFKINATNAKFTTYGPDGNVIPTTSNNMPANLPTSSLPADSVLAQARARAAANAAAGTTPFLDSQGNPTGWTSKSTSTQMDDVRVINSKPFLDSAGNPTGWTSTSTSTQIE